MIPKTFRLANRQWRVKFVDEKAMDKVAGPGTWGACCKRTHTIYLHNDLKDEPLETLLHTFEHEITHAILIARGNIGDHDEEFVEGWSAMRRQFETTKRGAVA